MVRVEREDRGREKRDRQWQTGGKVEKEDERRGGVKGRVEETGIGGPGGGEWTLAGVASQAHENSRARAAIKRV